MRNIFLYLLFSCCIVTLLSQATFSFANETTVVHTTSVQASGGTSEAYVYTEVNGEVIEENTYYSDDGNISVSSYHTSQGNTSTTVVPEVRNTSENTAETLQELRARLEVLLALLQSYVIQTQ